MRKGILAGLVAVAILAGCGSYLAGCGSYNDARGIGDAPVGKRHEAPRQVWASSDGFMNVEAYCIGENGVYVHTREAPPVIVRDDPNCDEGGILHA